MPDNSSLNRMLTEPVGSLILKNAVPTIITMMVTAIYNTADTFFVSRLGTSASGAVGIIFTLMFLMQAVAFTIGMGSGSVTSRALGAKDFKKANTYCSTAVFTAFFSGVLFTVFGNIFRESLVRHLGATPTILPYALDYAKYILFGAPFIISSFAMNNLLRFQGRAAFSMVGMIAGGIINIILDPFFIFVFDWGISGAAIATLISQIISFSILLSMFIRKKSLAELSFFHISLSLKTYTDIITSGLPSFFRQGMGALSGIFLNRQAAFWGAATLSLAATSVLASDSAVAGMAICNRVDKLLLAVAIGLGQGFQPVCGMNYGAGKNGRVREAYVFLVKLSAIIMSACAILVFIFAPEIVRFFRDDDAVVFVGSLALRAQSLVLPFHSLIFGTNMLLQVAGEKKSATFLSSMRQGLFFIPCIFILPHAVQFLEFEPILGVQLTQAVCDMLAAVCSIPFMVRFFRKLKAPDF
ncbi:MATE family efflux transporter [Treponema sp.]|uniref:MATE family efflux transporter n=1 Tax=Treponema sp. TaxID=166 RepID=UPI00388FB638